MSVTAVRRAAMLPFALVLFASLLVAAAAAGPAEASDPLDLPFQATYARISPDGSAAYVVGEAPYGEPPKYIVDLQTGAETRIYVAFDVLGESDDLRFLFGTTTAQLVPGDTNGTTDVYRYDWQADTYARVSVSHDGTQADWYCSYGDTSADGRYAAFRCADNANALILGTPPSAPYVKDLETGTLHSPLDGANPQGFRTTNCDYTGRAHQLSADGSRLLVPSCRGSDQLPLAVTEPPQTWWDSDADRVHTIGLDGTGSRHGNPTPNGAPKWNTYVNYRDLSPSGRFAYIAGYGSAQEAHLIDFDAETISLIPGLNQQWLTAHHVTDAGVTYGLYKVYVEPGVYDYSYVRVHPNGTVVRLFDWGTDGPDYASTSADGSTLLWLSGGQLRFETLPVGGSPVAQGADAARGAAAGTGSAADPVNTATGELVDTVVDLTVDDLGGPLQLARSYNSGDSRSGVFGRGWTASFEQRATVDGATGDVVVADPSGRQLRYVADGQGGFVAPPGTSLQLTDAGAGMLELADANRTVTFDPAGRVVTVARPDSGDQLTYSYDAAGNVTAIAGDTVTVTLTYNPDGTVASASAGSRTVAYGYTTVLSGATVLQTVTSPAGRTTTYSYDDPGRLVSETDAAGITVHTTVYDGSGRVASQTDAAGQTTTFAYDVDTAWTGMVTVTMPDGGVWTDGYSGRVLWYRRDPTGVLVSYTYDDQLRVTAVHTADGDTAVDYDSAGRPVSVTRPAGLTTAWTYDSDGRVATVTEPSGAVFTYSYDTDGRTGTVDGPDGTTSYTYTADGLVATVTGPAGGVTSYSYDAAGRTTAQTTPGGQTTTFTYDSAGRLDTVTAPDGGVSDLDFDADGLLTAATDPLGRTTAYGYDLAGRLMDVTSHDGRTVSATLDAAGRVASVIDQAGRTTSYTYDPVGRTASVTDPAGTQVTYSYDLAGRLAAVATPLGTATRSYTDGRLAGEQLADGTAVAYRYDAAGRLDQVVAGTVVSTFAYDAAGRVAQRSSGTSTATYGYDLLGRVAYATVDGAATTYTRAAGRLVSVEHPDRTTDSYSYDDAGRIVQINRGNTTLLTRTFDSAGRLAATSDASGAATTFAYDLLGRPVSRTVAAPDGTVRDAETITYDVHGNPVQVDTENGTTGYVYDQLDRLVRACFGQVCDGTETDWVAYTYDLLGNRQTRTTPAGTDTYTYTPANLLQRVDHADGSATNFSFDARGQLTAAAGWTYSWDGRGRLVSATDGTTTVDYGYNALDQRVSEVASYPGTGKGNKPITVVETTTTAFDPLEGYRTSVDVDGDTTGLLPHGLGVDDRDPLLFHRDLVGSVSAVTVDDRKDPAMLVSGFDYLPFGQLASTVGDPTVTDERFNGYVAGRTPLLQAPGRFYDPAVGRFASLDPYGGGYLHAANAPVALTDPAGLAWCDGSWDLAADCAAASPAADTAATAAAAAVPGAPGLPHGVAGASDLGLGKGARWGQVTARASEQAAATVRAGAEQPVRGLIYAEDGLSATGPCYLENVIDNVGSSHNVPDRPGACRFLLPGTLDVEEADEPSVGIDLGRLVRRIQNLLLPGGSESSGNPGSVHG